MILVAIGLLIASLLISAAEVYFERDWPRSTFKYVLIFALVLIAALR